MRYIIAVLSFLAIVFGYVVIAVILRDVTKIQFGAFLGVFVDVLAFSLAIGISKWILKKMSPKVDTGLILDNDLPSPIMELTKLEKKDFEKVFTEKVMSQHSISSITIEAEDGEMDYRLYFKMDSFENLDQQAIRKLLSKRFYAQDRISLEEWNENVIGFTIS